MIKLSPKIKNLLLSVESILFLTAIFVCVLCDFLINRSLTWSLYTVGACLLAWLVSLPLIRLDRHRLFFSACTLSVFVIPFLFLVEYACSVKGWMLPLGLPITFVSLLYLWVVVILFIKAPINRWYTASIAALLSVPLSFATNFFIANYTGEKFIDFFKIFINIGSSVFVAAIFLFIGFGLKPVNYKKRS